MISSLTWDRGSELAQHKRFSVATDVKVYFCDPRSPWQRGTNENTNRLLRQYFPDGTDLSEVTQARLNAVAKSMNARPRKTLGYLTPAAKLYANVASTGWTYLGLLQEIAFELQFPNIATQRFELPLELGALRFG